jgi:hypothetical protein
MERSQSDEADAGQTAVCPTDWLERGNTKHDNHIQFRDIFCLQESLHVDDANTRLLKLLLLLLLLLLIIVFLVSTATH